MKQESLDELAQKSLEKNNTGNAIKLLFESITACAKDKDFKTAEALREQIFKIDPMALNEIIRSAEIIEAAKSEAIDKDHREVWARLYDNLSGAEANALYFALKNEVYGTDVTVFKQGEHKPWLYFVNSGRPKLIYLLDGVEVFLKLLGPGELAGQEIFLFDSVYTTSLITLSPVKLSFLDVGVLKRWKSEFPVLESKLLELVLQSEKTTDLLRAKGVDRRTQKRIKVSGKGTMQLMNCAGDPAGSPFHVDLCDMSQGGLCFYLQITKRETTRLLLGRKLIISYLDSHLDSVNAMGQSGTIVAARFHPFDECTVHVKFDTPLTSQMIDQL